ncbi:auxin-responsive protein SAUR36 [Carica papaya]|uniref:auxin-responsive protein SAUR36 n=1 Tax=Carica papaya TaxID=3649 RepID=UPI000B8CBC2F|nr:auxin-responsive protein SAUR36 [Carica papaya]
MKRLRGFRLGRKLVRFFKWLTRSRRKQPNCYLLSRKYNPVSKICSFARHLRRGAKRLCIPKSDPGLIRLGQNRKTVVVPKGHLAVYVGESNDDTRRVLVPVIYFNHPLFGELLKEAERVYGFNQPGRIMIPCRVSDFEKVQMRIAAWAHSLRRQQTRYWR